MDQGFEYIIKNAGIGAESAYPYKAVDGTCKKVVAVSTITGYADVTANDENGLMSAVQRGPVAVAIEADQSSFQFYSGGIISSGCGQNLDHG
jgi:hypothetical protein